MDRLNKSWNDHLRSLEKQRRNLTPNVLPKLSSERPADDMSNNKPESGRILSPAESQRCAAVNGVVAVIVLSSRTSPEFHDHLPAAIPSPNQRKITVLHEAKHLPRGDDGSSHMGERPSSLKRESSRSQSPQRRHRPKTPSGTHLPGVFDDDQRRPLAKGRVWNPEDPIGSRPNERAAGTPSHWKPSSQPRTGRPGAPPLAQPSSVSEDSTSGLVLAPETRPISQEQLVAEVKGIYAGLVMVESKCIEVDNAQSSQNDPAHKLTNEQWMALIALHRTLLHEHHDFFLASQHPSASMALKRLANKYAMPARMWRHGIHSFLELLRHRLPGSLEHMLSFIYLAYSMMALLYETVPTFEDTWIECLGDLGRYR